MLEITFEIIGLILTIGFFTFYNFSTSKMKAISKIVIVICFCMILKLYIKSLGFENEALFLVMKLGLLLMLVPMLGQYE